MKEMLDDFKKFVMRGNVLDLAVAVIIGAAFGAVVVSFTNDIILPIVGAVFGQASFNDLTFEIGDGIVYYGKFLTVLLNFVIIAFVIFLIVKAFEKMQSMRGATGEEAEPLTVEGELLTEIRDILKSQRSA
jgi:large conductance mechanosensitive channel